MRIKPLLVTSLVLIVPLLAEAGPVLVTGTPGDSMLLPPTNPSPLIGPIVSLAGLTPCFTYPSCPVSSSFTVSGITVSSPDGLMVLGDASTTTTGNELYDAGGQATSDPGDLDGSADITISAATGYSAFAVGIADSDDIVNTLTPVPITIEALGFGGSDLGSWTVTLPDNTINPFNGYFIVEDSTPDVYGLQISEPDGDTNGDYSGLAIDDIQTTPEPSTILFLFGGVAMIGVSRIRKRA